MRSQAKIRKQAYTCPRKKSRHNLTEYQDFLLNNSVDKVKWYGQSDESGDFHTSMSSAKTQIKSELTSYITKLPNGLSPLHWFREKNSRFKWKDSIKNPVEIILKLHNDLNPEDKLQKILNKDTVHIFFEAALTKKLVNGHTCMQIPKDRLTLETFKVLNATVDCDVIPLNLVELKLKELADIGYDELWKSKNEKGKIYISTKERGHMDKHFVDFLTNRKDYFKIPVLWSAPSTYTAEQTYVYNEVLKHLRSYGWSVLSGPGGSGKTHMMKSILHYSDEDDQEICIFFLGPTNRAVTILKNNVRSEEYESMNDGCIHIQQNLISSTIHAIASRTDLPSAKIVIIDEFSMCASEHADLLLSCKALQNACFLFAGDHLQLPPVGPGELLKPLLTISSLPVLTENHRATDNKLKSLIYNLRSGHAESAIPLEVHAATYEESFEQIFCRDCSLILCLRNEERIRYNSYVIKKHPTGNSRLDYLDDYRKLSSTWNPSSDKPPRSFIPFVGMKVRLQTNAFKPLHCRGMLGEIISVQLSGRTWHVDVSFDEIPESILKLEESLFALPDILRPAFATTLHDAQGSASDNVGIIFPSNQHCPLLTLESLYTAASRARYKLYFFTIGCRYSDMMSSLEQASPPRCTPLACLMNVC